MRWSLLSVVLAGSLGHIVILGLYFLVLLTLVGFLVDAGLLHGLLPGEELDEGRCLQHRSSVERLVGLLLLDLIP